MRFSFLQMFVLLSTFCSCCQYLYDIHISNKFFLSNSLHCSFLESDTPRTPTPQSPQCQVEDLIEKAGAKLACKECKKTYNSKSKAQLVSHIESQHLKFEIKCDLCDKQFKATSYLKQHQKKGTCAMY